MLSKFDQTLAATESRQWEKKKNFLKSRNIEMILILMLILASKPIELKVCAKF